MKFFTVTITLAAMANLVLGDVAFGDMEANGNGSALRGGVDPFGGDDVEEFDAFEELADTFDEDEFNEEFEAFNNDLNGIDALDFFDEESDALIEEEVDVLQGLPFEDLHNLHGRNLQNSLTCGLKLLPIVCPGKVKTWKQGWGNGSKKLGNGSLKISGKEVKGSCIIRAGPIANAVAKVVPKWQKNGSESVCADLCAANPGSGFCKSKPTKAEVCKVEPFLPVCPPKIDKCAVKIVQTVCPGKVKTWKKGWGSGSSKKGNGDVKISGKEVKGSCTIRAGPIANIAASVVPKWTPNPNDRRFLQEDAPAESCAELCEDMPGSGFCKDKPTKKEICEVEPYLSICPPKIDKCAIKVVNTVCPGRIKTWKKNWGNGSSKKQNGDVRISGNEVKGSCTIKAGPIADIVASVVPKWTENPNDRRQLEAGTSCADLCQKYPKSGFCSDQPTKAEICEVEPFLKACPPKIDKCAISVVNTVCPGKIKTNKKNWGNGSKKEADGDVRISGNEVKGSCTIRAGPIANIAASVVPKWTPNPNDRRFLEEEDVAETCADLCEDMPGSGFCKGKPSKQEICEVEPYLSICPPKIDKCAIKVVNTVCPGKIKTWKKNWGNGSSKKKNGEVKISGNEVKGSCTIKAGPIADIVASVVPKWTENPNDRRQLEQADKACAALCKDHPESGFCQDNPTKGDICAVEPFLPVCPVKIDECAIKVVNTVCPGQIKTSKKNWGNGSSKQADGDVRIAGNEVKGSCTVMSGPIADIVASVVPKWTPNPNDRRQLEEAGKTCADLCEDMPDSGFCSKKPTREEICEVEPFLPVCPPKIDKCAIKLVATVCPGQVKTWKKNWGNGSKKMDNGDVRLSGNEVKGSCTIRAGPIANIVASAVPKWTENPNDRRILEESAADSCADLCKDLPGSGFCEDKPSKAEVCEVEPFLSVCPPKIDTCAIKVVNSVCPGKIKTWKKNWGNGSSKQENGDIRIAGNEVKGSCSIMAGPIADVVASVVPKWTANPNDRMLEESDESKSVCGFVCELHPDLPGFCSGKPTTQEICKVEPYLSVCPPAIDQCGIKILQTVCPGQVKVWKKNWGNGSSKKENGDVRIAGNEVKGSCTIRAGPIADAVAQVVPKWTENPNDRRRLEESERVCADLCLAYPDSGFCTDKPTKAEICGVEPFLQVCPPSIDKCAIKIVQTVCPNKVKTWKKNWGNGSSKKPDGSVRIAGNEVKGSCTIRPGLIADAVAKVVPKWTANPNDRRNLQESEKACASLCEANPGSGFCSDKPSKQDICAAEPFLSVCPPKIDKCGIKLLHSVCPNRVKTWKKRWGNGSSKKQNGDVRISGNEVKGSCTIKAGPIADAVAKIVPKWTANPNDRRRLEDSDVCADLCKVYPGSGFCQEAPARKEICAKEPEQGICMKFKKRKRRHGNRNKPTTKIESYLTRVTGQCVADHKCASMRGDPHFVTFDGLKYDCQGAGEFVLAKSLQSDFQIQGRFQSVGRGRRAVSVTKAVSIDTGVEGAPELDVFTENVDGECVLNYYVNGEPAEFGEFGNATEGIEFMGGVNVGARRPVDYVFFTGSAVMYSVYARGGSFGCVMDNKFCLPPKLTQRETIVGLLGTPDGNRADDWMNQAGANLHHNFQTDWRKAYDYCTTNWCVHKEEDSIFGYLNGTSWSDFYGCGDKYDPSGQELVETSSKECLSCCAVVRDVKDNLACLLECAEGGTGDCKVEIENEEKLKDLQNKCPDPDGSEAEDRSGDDEKEEDKKVYCKKHDGDIPYKMVLTAFLELAVQDGDKFPGDEVMIDGKAYTLSDKCSLIAVLVPTSSPTDAPTRITESPTDAPTSSPTTSPTTAPSAEPTDPPAPDQPDPAERNGDPDGYVKGDPHFKTFGGEYYDFHGECDLVLLHNPLFLNGLGMDVHIRTKIDRFWSSVESAAIRIGQDTLEIRANPESDDWLWINGNLVSDIEEGKWERSSLSGLLVRFKQSSPGVREANIYIDKHHLQEKLMLRTFRSFVRVDLNWMGSKNFDGATGLLGSHDKGGARLGRDDHTFIANTHRFGQEWQVLDSEPKLFHSYEGAVVGQKCIMPPAYSAEAVSALRHRRLAEANITVDDAEAACEHLGNEEERKGCVFDVLATLDLSMASAW